MSFVRALDLLRLSLLLLAVGTGLTGIVQTFPQMLAVRFLQGMIIPASLTAVMAFLAQSGRKGRNLQRGMSLYVSATIAGGSLGRLLAGASTVLFAWNSYFYIIGALLFCCYFTIRPAADGTRQERKKGSAATASPSLAPIVRCLPVYLAIFLLFFVFCGVLNYLPFRILEISGSRSGLLSGIMYAGYVTGILTSMGAGAIIGYAGSESRVMLAGYLVFLAVLVTMLLKQIWFLFFLLFPFCGAMFLIHSVATAVVNRKAGARKGLASGIYVSCYYAGGVLGTYVPGLLFKGYGWARMIIVLIAVGFAGVGLLAVFFKAEFGRMKKK